MIVKRGYGDDGRHGWFCPVRLLIGLLALATFDVMCLLLSPRPALADITHNIHEIGVVSNPRAGNGGYYVAGDTPTSG